MANIIKKAFSYGISLRTEDLIDNILNRLTLKIERNMIIKIAIFESCVESAANKLEPHIILYYCKKLVSDFNSYFTQYKYEEKIISKNIGLTKARLALVIALKQTLKNALNLLGINAPNYMKSKTDIN
jgi:arginyl-tRNA synthetase